MISQTTLTSKKKPTPVVRVAYTLKTAAGTFLLTKDSKNITVKY
jgi:hypothetical protein